MDLKQLTQREKASLIGTSLLRATSILHDLPADKLDTSQMATLRTNLNRILDLIEESNAAIASPTD